MLTSKMKLVCKRWLYDMFDSLNENNKCLKYYFYFFMLYYWLLESHDPHLYTLTTEYG